MKKLNYPSDVVKAYKAGEIDDVLLKAIEDLIIIGSQKNIRLLS